MRHSQKFTATSPRDTANLDALCCALMPLSLFALVLSVALFCVAMAAGPASAQRRTAAPAAAATPQQVNDLNRQAMEAYQNLEFDQANELLGRALASCQRSNITGSTLARTHLNLGIVAVGGQSDNASGLRHFENALRADGAVQLDPLTSTPDIQAVFLLARNRVGGAATETQTTTNNSTTTNNTTETNGNATTETSTETQTSEPNGSGQGSGDLEHTAPTQQLRQTALPLYARVRSEARQVYTYYRAPGMREYQRVQMQPIGRGYGIEIPCTEVMEPAIEYYIVAFGTDGTPIGFAGAQSSPLTVPIVARRTAETPALPGRAPPEQCSESECPPGMEGCHGSSSAQTRAAGASCSADNQCASGSCRDFACVGDGGNNNGAPRFFVRLGAGASVSYAQQGMRTDRQPCAPNTDTDCTPVEGWRDPQSVADGNANGVPDDVDTTRSYGYDPGPRFSPGDWSQRTPCTSENGYCFYVETAGMVPNWMLRADVGYYVLDWLAIAAELRFQPNSGNTTSNGPSFMLAGLRAEFQLTPPVTSGFHAHAHVGLTFGQVQVFLSRGERSRYAPWAVSGPVGANVGATLGYRFVRNFGIYAQPIVMLQFPDFLFNLDIAGGVEFGF